MSNETFEDKAPNPLSAIELLTLKYNAGRKELLSGMQPGVSFDELFAVIAALQTFKAAAQQTLQGLVEEEELLRKPDAEYADPHPDQDFSDDILADDEMIQEETEA